MRRALACMLLACVVAGCERATPAREACEPAARASATSDLGALWLTLSRTEMTTTDRLEVRLVLEHRGGVSAGDLGFEPEQAGWTVISRKSSRPVILADGGVRLEWAFTLEPFLDGSYQVPPVMVDLNDGRQTAALTTPPQPVTVTSVLSDAAVELAPARPPIEAASRARGAVQTSVIGGAAFGLILCGGVLWWWRRARQSLAGGPDAIEQFTPGPRGQVARVRQELRESLAARVGSLPESATSEEMLQALRAHLSADQSARAERFLARIDRLCYGPEEPTENDVASVSAELASLELQVQEAEC